MTTFEERQKVCKVGERIVDAYIWQQGYIPYRPDRDAPHPFDRLVASPDKQRICIVECKTKRKRKAYDDTGINLRHFLDYQRITQKYRVPLFLTFIDCDTGTMYGNWWSVLIQPREHEGEMYPWHSGGIVYFPMSIMRTLYVLTEEECAELRALSTTNWKTYDD